MLNYTYTVSKFRHIDFENLAKNLTKYLVFIIFSLILISKTTNMAILSEIVSPCLPYLYALALRMFIRIRISFKIAILIFLTIMKILNELTPKHSHMIMIYHRIYLSR